MDEIYFPDLKEESDFWVSAARRHDQEVQVTVIISAYQADATLQRALESVQQQTMREIEMIIVDDGSTDSSWRMISNWLHTELDCAPYAASAIAANPPL